MSENNKNQQKSKEKNKNENHSDYNESSNAIDIVCLTNLQRDLNKASIALELVLQKLCIDADSMAKLQQSLGSNPMIWNIEQAKEFLDIIIANAALGKSQLLKHNDWVVQVISKTI